MHGTNMKIEASYLCLRSVRIIPTNNF